MREIQIHRSNLKGTDGSLDERIRLETADDADRQGINHKYQFFVHVNGQWEKCRGNSGKIDFHTGPLVSVDGVVQPVIGVSDVAVLAVLIDRLRSFQKDGLAEKYRSKAKAVALTHLETALLWLHEDERTKE